MDSVRKYLDGGTNSIAGVYLQSNKETMSIYEAKSKNLLTPGTSLVLLEAQAATGFIIDPVKNKKLSVEEAAAQGKVTVTEVSEMDSVRKYLEGTNSIAGVYLQSNKETMSIYEAKSKNLLTPGTSLVLLEAQAATGFIIRSCENKKLNAFHGIRKDVSASELLECKIIDEKIFEELNAGKVTVTEVSEMDSVRKYLEGTNSIAGVYLQSNKETMSIYEAKSKNLLTPGTSLVLLEAQAATGFIIDPVKNKKLNAFHGIRKDVSASELLECKIIDEKIFEELNAGKVTVTEVSEMDSVRKYLEGTNSIAGVYLQSNKKL
ncbi:hypothetical protein CRUP_019115 [Coryphaenoides rupestris]|nr:hypothetical protein CRUP_019115 [Coryphaenoides rupestris]